MMWLFGKKKEKDELRESVLEKLECPVDESKRKFMKVMGVGGAAVLVLPPLPAFNGFKSDRVEIDSEKIESTRPFKSKWEGSSLVEAKKAMEGYVDAMMRGVSWQPPSDKFYENPEEGWMFWHTGYEYTVIYDGEQWCEYAGSPAAGAGLSTKEK